MAFNQDFGLVDLIREVHPNLEMHSLDSCKTFRCFPNIMRLEYDPTEYEKLGDGSLKRSALAAKCTQKLNISNYSSNPSTLIVTLDDKKMFTMEDSFKVIRLYPAETIAIPIKVRNENGDRGVVVGKLEMTCRLGCSSMVPLIAVPKLVCLYQLPNFIDFGHVQKGTCSERKLILKPVNGIEMKFLFLIPSDNHNITLTPVKGVIQDDAVEVTLIYYAMNYITVNLPIHLYIPRVMSSPWVINIMGHTKPTRELCLDKNLCVKLEKKNVLKSNWDDGKEMDMLDSEEIETELDEEMHGDEMKAICGNDLTRSLGEISRITTPQPWNRHEMNKYLMAKFHPYELKENDIRGPTGQYKDEEDCIEQKLFREFQARVNHARNINKKALSSVDNRTKQVPYTGTHFMDRNIEDLWKDYRSKITSHINMLTNYEPHYVRKKFLRYPITLQEFAFTGQPSNLWFMRYLIMSKFIEAGRTVILKHRLLKNLEVLKKLRPEDVTRFENVPGEYQF